MLVLLPIAASSECQDGQDDGIYESTATVNDMFLKEEYADTRWLGFHDGGAPWELLISRSPSHAMAWICKRIAQEDLVSWISNEYDALALAGAMPVPSMLVQDEAEVGESEAGADIDGTTLVDDTTSGAAEDATDETTTQPKKRRRQGGGSGGGTKQAMERHRVKKLKHWEKCWASTQELLNDPNVRVGMNREQLAYQEYAERWGKMGLAAVEDLIRAGRSVASKEAFRDWSALMRVWRQQAAKGLGPLQIMTRSNDTALLAHDDIVPVYGLDVQSQRAYKEKYNRAMLMEGVKSYATIRHRIEYAELYEDRLEIERVIKEHWDESGGGRPGQGVATFAKTHLLKVLYS